MRPDGDFSVPSDETSSAKDPFVARGLIRPTSHSLRLLLLRIGGVFGMAGGAVGLAFRLTSFGVLIHPGIQLFVCLVSLGLGCLFLVLSFFDFEILHRFHAPLLYLMLLGASLLATLGLYSVGPHTLIGVILYAEVAIFAFFLLPTIAAIAVVIVMAIEFGALLNLQGGYPAPFAQWIFVVGAFATIGATVGGLLGYSVDETIRLSRLRTFLPPQVADAVLTERSDELLRPHRKQIAVLFCDLRGYTQFSGTSEPEEVVELLTDYYDVVGQLLRSNQATIGTLGGDGVMAYFNDPVPCNDPAAKAVEVAVALRRPLSHLVSRWERRGFTIGYGVGIAYGYATLGVIGFEGRHDYTALGSVVNLAARLSDEAGSNEILVDQRAYDALDARVEADPVTLQLKGFAQPMTAYRVKQTGAADNETRASEALVGGSDKPETQ